MYKKIAILILALVFLVSCKQKDKTSGGDNLKNKKYNAIYLADNLYLVTKSQQDLKIGDLANISISNKEKLPKMGNLIGFDKIDGINESYPVQTTAYDVELSEELVKGASISINKVQTLAKILGDPSMVVDVRTQEEYDEGHLEEVSLIPLDEIESRLSELNKNKVIFVYCRSGKRSSDAQKILERNGFFAINAGGVNDFEGKLVK